MNSIFQNTKCLSVEDIQNYLAQKVNNDERYRIENHLLDCPLCNDAIEGFAQNYSPHEENDFGLPKQFIEQKNQETKIKAIPANRFSWTRVAAAVLLLLLPSFAVFNYYNQNQHQRLFTNNFEPYSDATLSNLRSSSATDMDENLQAAFQAYNSKDFNKSLLFLENYLEKNQNADLTFYAGLAALESNQLEKALDHFKTSRINANSFFLESSWYLGLTHLKRNEVEEAQIIFKELVSQKDDYYDKKASAILQKLD